MVVYSNNDDDDDDDDDEYITITAQPKALPIPIDPFLRNYKRQTSMTCLSMTCHVSRLCMIADAL